MTLTVQFKHLVTSLDLNGTKDVTSPDKLPPGGLGAVSQGQVRVVPVHLDDVFAVEGVVVAVPVVVVVVVVAVMIGVEVAMVVVIVVLMVYVCVYVKGR